MRVQEEYKKIGYFWLPEKEENKIAGTLTINDGGKIELEILGLFDNSVEAFNGDNNLGRIIGHVEKDGPVTLENCFYTKKSFSSDVISNSKVLVNQILSGAAWGKDEKVRFNTLSFSVDGLYDWVGISGITINKDQDSETTVIGHKQPDPIKFPLDNGMTLEILFDYTRSASPAVKELKITQQVYFKISSDSLCELSEFTALAFKITHLMCFAVGETVSINTMWATSSEIMCDVGEKQYPKPIKIYYQSNPYTEKEPNRDWDDMLFTFGMIRNNARQIFNHWINAYDDLSPVFGLYFSTKTGAHKYLESRFLALAQALETYHRRTCNEKKMEQEDYDDLVKTIMDACPENEQEWLEDRLKYGNEISLRQRLKRIVEPFKQYIGSKKERKELLAKIVDTRNYLTHYDGGIKDKAVQGIELWKLCKKMDLIFNLHFLKLIGLTDDEIDAVVKNSKLLNRY